MGGQDWGGVTCKASVDVTGWFDPIYWSAIVGQRPLTGWAAGWTVAQVLANGLACLVWAGAKWRWAGLEWDGRLDRAALSGRHVEHALVCVEPPSRHSFSA